MKRILAIVLALLFLFSSVSAEMSDELKAEMKKELDQASYEEMITFYKFLVSYIMSRPEWKEVEVPAGEWIVGDDIPAGSYSLSAVGSSSAVTIYGKNGYNIPELIYLTEEKGYGKVILENGWKIELSSPVVFAPPKGLGF